jgi:predicted RNA-binding protein with PIN domain
MSWVVDGSNFLGSSRSDASEKRRLVQALAQFARAKRTKVICTFDGVEPEHFGKHLGGVSVVFSGARAADDLIEKRVATGSGWKVVTDDRALAGRVRRRAVEVVDRGAFLRQLESVGTPETTGATDDWAAYFADAKNRNIF